MKYLRRFAEALFPPPRRAVTWRAAIPLIVFLVAFAGLCLGLEYGRVLMFARPGGIFARRA